MLIEAVAKEKEEIRRESMEEGLEKGRAAMRTTIQQLLAARFERVPDEVVTALGRCTLDQLQTLVNPALDASDLDVFLTHIPAPDVEESNDENSEETTTKSAESINDASDE